MLRYPMVAAVLLLLSFHAVAQASDADLSLRFSPSEPKVHPSQTVTWSALAVNKGPQFAQNVVVTIDMPGEIVNILSTDMTCAAERPIRCTMPSLPPNNPGSGTVVIITKAPAAPGIYAGVATIAGSTRDPNPADNTASSSIEVSSAPNASVQIARGDRILPGQTRHVMVSVGTGSGILHDVRLTLRASGGATIAAIAPPAAFTCTGTLCTAPAFGPQFGSFDVTFVAPGRENGGKLGLDAAVTSNDDDFDPRDNEASLVLTLVRQYTVTTLDDSAGGSLRQAILDSNASCAAEPCRIIFALNGTIHPQSPLPALRGMVTLQGAGIELRGDRLPSGDGLTIDAACEVAVLGLSIHDFAGNGITIGSSATCSGAQFPPVVISGNDIRGTLRGIVGSAADTVSISNNTIAGNLRSAIFLYGGRVAQIEGNVLQSNGASGIYVNTFSAGILQNVISGNTDFGIAVSATAPRIAMRRNRIFGNGHTAIDIGLDLETPNGDDARAPALNHPLLLDAHYDAAGERTIVRGRYDTKRSNGTVVLEFFASTARRTHAEAERYLGELKIFDSRDFEFVAPGDLTGLWISATATMEDYLTAVADATSELSEPIRVSP